MKLYQTPTLIVVCGVPEIFGAAANALSGASSTATNESGQSESNCSHARKRARAFFDDMGMQIPIRRPIYAASHVDAARTRTPNFRTA